MPSNWKNHLVHQRDAEHGCIPTCYEFLLRAYGFKNIDFTSFQEEFNLHRKNPLKQNNFTSIAAEIEAKHPFVKFSHEIFGKEEGLKKISRIEKILTNNQYVAVSLHNAPFNRNGYHIYICIEADNEKLTLLEYVPLNGDAIITRISKSAIVAIHEKFPGGDDIAYISKDN